MKYKIGQKTIYGIVSAIGMKEGERWAMMEKDGVVSLMPNPDITTATNNCIK